MARTAPRIFSTIEGTGNLNPVMIVRENYRCRLCHLTRNGACRSLTTYSGHHSSNHHAPQNHTTDFHLNSPYTVGSIYTSQTYYPSSSQQQTQADNVHNNNIIVTAEPSAPPLEAVTHAGEAPPAYHTAMHYKTVDPDTEDVRLSKNLALSEHPTSTTESDAPPVYKEAHD